MELTQALAQLDALGTEQNRKVYRRHGARDPLAGVSYGNFAKLKKAIRTDHALACQLWAAGHYDAMILATMIADPQQATAPLVDAWASDLYCYTLTDQLAGYVGQTALAPAYRARWVGSDDEWLGRAGWHLVAMWAMSEEPVSDDAFHACLDTIARDIHGAKNFTRHAMNNALIAIGSRDDDLERLALDVARTIGKVVVDHGQTGCKTPDALVAIPKTRAHRARRQARPAARL